MKNIIIMFVVLGLFGSVVYFWGLTPARMVMPGENLMRYTAAVVSGEKAPEFSAPEVDYRNERFGFSLKRPTGFTVAELPPDDGAATILIQNGKGEGIQILITPGSSPSKTLTADMIRADIPDMQVRDVQVVEVGENHRGIAFLSDNEAFNGASREVWFFFRGNLYQISTYAYLDTLMQQMFATWQFK